MAPTGQEVTHAPHPVQASGSTTAVERPPGLGRKRMAEVSQVSPQIRQVTPFGSTQAGEMAARSGHGARDRLSKHPASQTSAQAPQKVHPPRSNETIGYPA